MTQGLPNGKTQVVDANFSPIATSPVDAGQVGIETTDQQTLKALQDILAVLIEIREILLAELN